MHIQLLLFLTFILIECNCKMSKIYTSGGEYQNQSQYINCLWKQGYLDQTFISVRYNYVSDFIKIEADPLIVFQITQTKPHLVLWLDKLKYENSPQNQANMHAQILKNVPIKILWVQPVVKDMKCLYLFRFVSSLQKLLKIQVGISATNAQWKAYFGDEYACIQQFRPYKLLAPYQFQNQQFQPFGPWASCDLRLIVQTQQYLCVSWIYQIKACNQRKQNDLVKDSQDQFGIKSTGLKQGDAHV